MNKISEHTFHIPVMGLGYTIDTPVKVARFGISSVVSIIEDDLVEEMREYYCKKIGEEYIAIEKKDPDHRAKRIIAYLNLMDRMVNDQVEHVRTLPFEKGNDLAKYFELLPDDNKLKKIYLTMLSMQQGEGKILLQAQLRAEIVPGSIDVNIMTKIDRDTFDKDGTPNPFGYSDALAALRGFADS